MKLEPSPPAITIVVVDDHPLASAGVARLLKREPDMHVAAVCLNPPESIDAVRRLEPAIVVFEFANPRSGGTGLLRAVGSANPEARAVIVSRHPGDLEDFRAAGASGFVATEQASLHLVACVRAVHFGATWIEYTGQRKRLGTPPGGSYLLSG